MSKIATISCIILAVSINLEGTQASLLGNRLNPLNGLLDKLPLDKLEETITDIGKDVSNLGADFTNELNLNDGVIKQASIFTCAKLLKEASQTINELGSIGTTCVLQEMQVVNNYVQSINQLVTDLNTAIQNKIQEILQGSGNVLDKIQKLMDQLPDFINQVINPKVEKIYSTVEKLFSTVPKDLKECWDKSPNAQKDYDNLVKDIQDCVKSVPGLG